MTTIGKNCHVTTNQVMGSHVYKKKDDGLSTRKLAKMFVSTVQLIQFIGPVLLLATHTGGMRREDGEDIFAEVTSYGQVKGKSYPSQYELKPNLWINVWLGIPYAKRLSQFGNDWREKFRFMNPEKPSWYGTWDATFFKPSCPQMPWLIRETIPGFINTDEDCLYLNVYSPRVLNDFSGTALYPVLVFFHGGGFIMGSSQQYPGHFLAERLVVVVTVNYRLNALGFLSTGDRYSPGNYGMFDQIQALRFIKETISSFKGNPNSITIMGHSAGAASVGLHLLSPRSENLFNQAIMMGGSDLSEWAVISKADSSEYAQRLAYEVGCPTSDSQRLIDCLRYSRSFSEIVNASARVQMLPGKIGNPWGPVVDGQIVGVDYAFLPDPPLDMRRQGRMKKLKILAGINSDDGGYFIPNLPRLYDGITQAQFDNILQEFLQYRNIENYNNVFSALQFQYTYWPVTKNMTYIRQQCIKMMSDYMFGSAMNQMLEFQVVSNTVYMYVFKYRSWNSYVPAWRGISHGEELQYVFGFPFINDTYINLTGIYPRQTYDYADRNISEYMISMWTNFTSRGNPTPQGQPIIWFRNSSWLEYNLQNHSYLSIANVSENLTNYRQTEYGFWQEYFPDISGKGYYLAQDSAQTSPAKASIHEIATYALAAFSGILTIVVIIMCIVCRKTFFQSPLAYDNSSGHERIMENNFTRSPKTSGTLPESWQQRNIENSYTRSPKSPRKLSESWQQRNIENSYTRSSKSPRTLSESLQKRNREDTYNRSPESLSTHSESSV